MATYESVFIPEAKDVTATLATVTATAEILIGINNIFAIQATDDMHIKFGTTGMAAASASNWKIPAGSIFKYDMGRAVDTIRLFNPTGATITYWIQFLSRS